MNEFFKEEQSEMKNTKRILLLSLSCALAFVIALCGFSAYANSNVDAVSGGGNSSSSQLIQQLQYQRTTNGVSELSANTSSIALGKLYPAVYSDLTTKGITADDLNFSVWENMEGAVDDIVCVKNIAGEAIYVRTVFAFESGNVASVEELKNNVLINKNENNQWTWSEVSDLIIIDGQKYYICCATYADSLGEGAATAPCLYQIALAKDISKELFRSFGSQYDVKVVSQAATVAFKENAGFENKGANASAETVLDYMHGTITADNHPWK